MNLDPIKEFLDSNARNTWLSVGPLDLYVRKAVHMCKGEAEVTFDLANFVIRDERKRGKGLFTQFLSRLYPVLLERGFKVVYIESVLNERLEYHLEKIGYDRAGPDEYAPSFYYRLTP